MIGYDQWKLATPELIEDDEQELMTVSRTPVTLAIKYGFTSEEEAKGFDYYTEEVYRTHTEYFLETKSGKRIRL